MRSWHRNLRDIGWSLAATRNEGLGPNSICSAPNLRRAPTRPEAPTTLEARERFSDQRRPPDQKANTKEDRGPLRLDEPSGSRVLQERRKEHVMNERNDMQAKLGMADRRHTLPII